MSEESKQTKISAGFQRAWIGHELPAYRKVDATYGLFPYDSLPPLNRKLDGSLSWLTEMDTVVRKEMEPHWRSDRDRCRIDARLEPTIAEAERQGYGLPNVFLSFMRSQSARQRIPSYAACYFDAPD